MFLNKSALILEYRDCCIVSHAVEPLLGFASRFITITITTIVIIILLLLLITQTVKNCEKQQQNQRPIVCTDRSPRKNYTPTPHSRTCSLHFRSGDLLLLSPSRYKHSYQAVNIIGLYTTHNGGNVSSTGNRRELERLWERCSAKAN